VVAGPEDAAKRKAPLLEDSELEALRPVCQLHPNRAVALVGEATADGAAAKTGVRGREPAGVDPVDPRCSWPTLVPWVAPRLRAVPYCRSAETIPGCITTGPRGSAACSPRPWWSPGDRCGAGAVGLAWTTARRWSSRYSKRKATTCASPSTSCAELADEVRAIAREQQRWIKIASAYPVGPGTKNARGVEHTDWIPIDQATYEACLETRGAR